MFTEPSVKEVRSAHFTSFTYFLTPLFQNEPSLDSFIIICRGHLLQHKYFYSVPGLVRCNSVFLSVPLEKIATVITLYLKIPCGVIKSDSHSFFFFFLTSMRTYIQCRMIYILQSQLPTLLIDSGDL